MVVLPLGNDLIDYSMAERNLATLPKSYTERAWRQVRPDMSEAGNAEFRREGAGHSEVVRETR